MTARAPDRLGRYKVLGRLARGGMAEVFLARQEGPQGFARTVVIKQILPEFANDPAFLQMFLNEARLAALINHPNVVSIIELGEEAAANSYYIVMEFIEGRDVKTVAMALTATGVRFPHEVAVRIIADACSGLHFAHELKGADDVPLNIVHRDISLDNLLITYSGMVKVVDFGIAKAVATEGRTAVGQVKGKLSYMAPEHLAGKPIDRRADIWSLGVTLYTLLANGKKPFAGHGVDVMHAVIYTEPPPIEGLAPELERIVRRTLAKDLAQRYPTARALQDDLERWLVASGKVVGGSVLSDFMERLFPETTDPTRSQLVRVARRPTDPALPAVSKDLATPLPKLAAPAPPHAGGIEPTRTTVPAGVARGAGRTVWLTAMVVFLVAVGGMAVAGRFPWLSPAEQPPVAPPSQQAAPLVAAPAPPIPAPAPAAPPAEPAPQVAPPAPKPTAVAARPPRAQRKAATAPETSAPVPAPAAPPQRAPEPEAPLAARGPPGTLIVKVAPWALVFLDGRPLGTTPFAPMSVPSGTHTLHLVNEDLGVQKDLVVEVRPGEASTVRVKMSE